MTNLKQFSAMVGFSICWTLLLWCLGFQYAFAATTYHLNCTTDIVGSPTFDGGGGACTGANFVYTGSGYWTTTASVLTGGTQWYITYNTTSGDNMRWGDTGSTNDVTYSGDQVDAALGIGSNGQMLVYKPASGGLTLSSVCLSDTPGDCGGSPTPAGTTTEATSTIEQTEQNTNWGFALFLASMWFIMWVFKRR